MSKKYIRGRTVTAVSSLSFPAPKPTIRVIHHHGPGQEPILQKVPNSLPCFVRPESKEASNLKIFKVDGLRKTNATVDVDKNQRTKQKKLIKLVDERKTGKLLQHSNRKTVTLNDDHENLLSRINQMETVMATQNAQKGRNETLPNFLRDCGDKIIERLTDCNATKKAPDTLRRLYSPRREQKPHCPNDIMCRTNDPPARGAPTTSRTTVPSVRNPAAPPAKSPARSDRVETDRLPNFSRVDVRSAIAEGNELLKEIKSWHKTLEKASAPRPVAERRKPESGGVPIRRNSKRADLVARRGDLKKKTSSELDLRTDMESLKKEVKSLSKKIARKSERKQSKKDKEGKGDQLKDNETGKLQVPAAIKNQLIPTHSHEPEPLKSKLTVAMLQNLIIKRPLAVQSGPRIVISPKPLLTKVSNVHFATYEHKPTAAVPDNEKSLPHNQVAMKMVHVSKENAAVATDAIPVSTTGCQTSPPPRVFNIFAQTEEVTVRTRRTMVSVAVQSSPEVKTPCSDLEVQTEIVHVNSVGTETTTDDQPVTLKVADEVEERLQTQVGPSGDATSAFMATSHDKEPSEDKTQELFKPSRISLSPILEVPSTNISPDIISPLTTPKASLVIPETSQSDQSAVSSDAPKQEHLEKRPKSVGFSDLPILLRLRSPSLRVAVPSYTRSALAKRASTFSDLSTDDDDDDATRNNELLTSEVQTSSASRSTSPTSTASSIEFTTSSSAAVGPKAPISIPLYQMNRVRSLAAKVAPKLLENSTSDGELSEGQIWPLPRVDFKKP